VRVRGDTNPVDTNRGRLARMLGRAQAGPEPGILDGPFEAGQVGRHPGAATGSARSEEVEERGLR
jgi:hypothetical protein